ARGCRRGPAPGRRCGSAVSAARVRRRRFRQQLLLSVFIECRYGARWHRLADPRRARAELEAARRGVAACRADRRSDALDLHHDGSDLAWLGGARRRARMVAAARVTAWAGGAAALLAAGFIAALAFTGERPEAGLDRFRPAGVLAGWPVEDIVSIEIVASAEHRLFRRGPDRAWEGIGSDTAQRIETGLTLLRNAAPPRVFAA